MIVWRVIDGCSLQNRGGKYGKPPAHSSALVPPQNRRVSVKSTAETQALTKAIADMGPTALKLPYREWWMTLTTRLRTMGIELPSSVTALAPSTFTVKHSRVVVIAMVKLRCDNIPLDRWPKEHSRLQALVCMRCGKVLMCCGCLGTCCVSVRFANNSLSGGVPCIVDNLNVATSQRLVSNR